MQTTTTSVPSGIEAIVCNDITQRQLIGIKKYGTTVAENPLLLRDWLQHAYEETLDQAVYLRRAISEIDSKTELKERNDCYRAIKELQKAIDKLNQKEDPKSPATSTVYEGTVWGAHIPADPSCTILPFIRGSAGPTPFIWGSFAGPTPCATPCATPSATCATQ